MLFHQHVAWCDEMCLTSYRVSSSFWTIFGCLCQTSQTASLSVLQLVVAVCCCIVYAFVCQVDTGSWDTEIQDDVGLHMHRRTGAGGTAPVRFSMCGAVTMNLRDDKTRATPFGMALVLFAKEAPWGLGSRDCGPATATVSYDLRNVWFCAFVPEL